MFTRPQIKLTKPILAVILLTALLAAGNLTSRLTLYGAGLPAFRTPGITAGPTGPVAQTEDEALRTDPDGKLRELGAITQEGVGEDLQMLASADSLPTFSDRVIKTGSITLRVGKGRFYQTYDKVMAAARAHGGQIAASNSYTGAGDIVSGNITIRVPSENFEEALSKLRKIGNVTAIDISSADVSGEYIDLESRLRHWRAQERVMLVLMDKTDTITDSITIQQQLSQIQMEIEQITGRLEYLKDHTTYSTLTVNISEPGAAPAPVAPWGLAATFMLAARAFTDTLKGLIVLTGYLAPLGLLFGLWLGVRAAQKRSAAQSV